MDNDIKLTRTYLLTLLAAALFLFLFGMNFGTLLGAAFLITAILALAVNVGIIVRDTRVL